MPRYQHGHSPQHPAIPRNYRLTFGGTRKRLFAATLKNALSDARYWLAAGQMKVCIDQMLPSGRARRIRCVSR